MFARFLLLFSLLLGTIQANATGIFSFPLCQGTTTCSAYPYGAYTPGVMNSLLDHSMKYVTDWPYGTVDNGGGDGIIIAFNGDTVSGTPFAWGSSTKNCITGVIHIYPDPPIVGQLMNYSGCGSTGTSYEDHPGYDYSASYGTPVYAAASGQIVSTVCKLRNMGGTCASWGGVGVVTPSGYVYQYFHMSSFAANMQTPGTQVTEGQFIGYSGNTGLGCSGTSCSHLHFEVIYWSNTNARYVTIDPYGWVGSGTDPLQSQQPGVASQNLWK